jgi:hypothetical protein
VNLIKPPWLTPVDHGRVISNSALKRRNDGRFSSNRVFFEMAGVIALVRLEKLTKTLKQKGILEVDYKEE